MSKKFRTNVESAPARSLDLAVSNICDNQCVFCADRSRRIDRAKSYRTLVELLGKARESGVEQVEFSALEPLYRADLIELIRQAKKLRFTNIHVVTNGHVLKDRAYCKRLITAGLTKLTLSIHSCCDDTEHKITGNPRSFQQKQLALANIQWLNLSKRIEIANNIVLNRYNYKQLTDTMDLISKHGIIRFNVFFPRLIGNALKNFDRIVPSYKVLAQYLDNAYNFCQANGFLLSFIDIPFCVICTGRNAVNSRLRKIVLNDEAIRYFDASREKSKRQSCRACIFTDRCEGVYVEYVKKRGWREFQPVKSDI